MTTIFNRVFFCLLLLVLSSCCQCKRSKSDTAKIEEEIRGRFEKFVIAFDKKDIGLAMEIFGEDVVSEFQGFAPRGFKDIQKGILNTFEGPLVVSQAYEIKEIIHELNPRITT